VLLIIPLIFANVIEVFARYVLKAPTVWAVDVTTMSYAALFMLGSALALLKGAHVRTDILWEAFSDRTKGMIDSLAFLLLFLPTMVVLFFISIDDFLYSISIDERSSSGAWRPVLWPLLVGYRRSPMHQACILLASHTPARINRLVKTRATALTIMRCRYSSSLSGHSYLARSGTGDEVPIRGRNRITRPSSSMEWSEPMTKYVAIDCAFETRQTREGLRGSGFAR
jgi:hypothetical protein